MERPAPVLVPVTFRYDIENAPRGSRQKTGEAGVRGGGTREITGFTSPRILVCFMDNGVAKTTVTHRIEPSRFAPKGRWSGFSEGKEIYAWAPMPEPVPGGE